MPGMPRSIERMARGQQISKISMIDPCPHIAGSVRIGAVPEPELQCRSPSKNNEEQPRTQGCLQWKCEECKNTSDPWICLSCAIILCGRDVNRHGLRHFHQLPSHCVVMHCITCMVYCYACDEFCYGDLAQGNLTAIRSSANRINRKYGGIRAAEDNFDLGTEEEDELDPYTLVGNALDTDEDSRSVPEDTMPLASACSLYGGRVLRPRKRHYSRSPSMSVPSERRVRSGEDGRLRGLRNLGNTCYFNSVVQALNTTDVFREYLIKLPFLEPDDDVVDYVYPAPGSRYNTRRAAAFANKGERAEESNYFISLFAEELRKVFLKLLDLASGAAYSPDEFWRSVSMISPRFQAFQQQDAHDFLRVAMERIHNDLRRCRIPESADKWLNSQCFLPSTPNSSAITRIFEGSLLSQVVCQTCHTASNKQETFMDLSLEICWADPPEPKITLSDCIHRFFEKEELEQREQYMCGHCMDKRPSTKQLMLSVLPTVLCLHLKRFRWTHNSRGKLDTMVDFPLTNLDIGQFMITGDGGPSDGTTKYNLTAIVVHHGQSFQCGHYTAYGKRNNSWFHFNDSTVRLAAEQDVLKQKAYLLFYTRVR